MFCPVCKGEFVAGVTICSSCNRQLVDALPDELPPPSLDLVTLARFLQPVDAEVAASYLEANGISVLTRDAHTLGLNWLFASALGGVQLTVPQEQADAARELLAARDAATIPGYEPDEFAGGQVPLAELAQSRRTNRFKVLLTLLLLNPLLFLVGVAARLARGSKNGGTNDRDGAA